MSEKTDSKKQLIIDKATEVFCEKGFRDVTMKDIVEACEISRGGLYLYYGSTEEIFIDVCNAYDNDDSDESNAAKLAESSPSELLLWFIKEQKKEILSKRNSLAVARYEYAFFCKENSKAGIEKKRFDTALMVLANILNRGMDVGDFVMGDFNAIARNMMYAIEGLKIHSRTIGISEKKVDSELLFMMKQFVEA